MLSYKYERRAVKTQLCALLLQVVHLAVNNYTFRPLYWPSSGCTPSCYKVTTQNTVCLLLMTRSRSQNFVARTNINSSGQTQSALDNNVQSNWVGHHTHWSRSSTQLPPSCITLNCCREHFVSVPLELMLVHATEFCQQDLAISNRHILYCTVTL